MTASTVTFKKNDIGFIVNLSAEQTDLLRAKQWQPARIVTVQKVLKHTLIVEWGDGITAKIKHDQFSRYGR